MCLVIRRISTLSMFVMMWCVFFSSFSHAIHLNPDGGFPEKSTKYSCADMTRGAVKLVMAEGSCTGFIERAGKADSATTDFAMHISGVVLASADASTVVAIQNDLYGSMGSDGVFSAGDSLEYNPFVVLIYREGKQIGAYRLNDILHRPSLVQTLIHTSMYRHSAQKNPAWKHVKWLQYYRWQERDGEMKIILGTTSLREVIVNLRSGKIAEEHDAQGWSNCDVIARGPVATMGTRAQMGPVHLLKGQLNGELSFAIAPKGNVRGAGADQTLCLVESSSGLIAMSALPLQFDEFEKDLYQPVVAKLDQPSKEQEQQSHFHVELLNTEYFWQGNPTGNIWKLLVQPDRPMQRVTVSLRGSKKLAYYCSDIPGVGLVTELWDIPENAVIEISGVDGHGHPSGPYSQDFDLKKVLPKFPDFLMSKLKSDPHKWVQIFGLHGGKHDISYLNFSTVAKSYCGLREVRYSIDNKSLDQRFPVPRCNVADLETYLKDVYDASLHDSDYGASDVKWRQTSKYVAVQLVFFDGTLSDVVIERNDSKFDQHHG
jgi:hypothetical protein